MPFFSVIIPNYNHALFLRERIDSVLNQTYTDFEIIILDDHSTDNSRQIIEEYRSNNKVSHILLNEKNSNSLLLQWKKGVELAKGDWIWIAESDDIADPAFLEKCINSIHNQSTAGLWYSDSNILNDTNQEITSRFSERKNTIFKTQKWNHAYFQNGIAEINECLKYDCTVNNVSAAVFKRDLALPLLYQATQFRYYPDWYFFLKLCLLTDICYSPKPLNTYRFHSGSVSNTETSLVNSKREYFEILKLLYNSNKVTDKNKLLSHYSFNYLSFGVLKDGPGKLFSIIKTYFAIDKKLATKVLLKIFLIKLFFQRYKAKFELIDKQAPGSKLF